LREKFPPTPSERSRKKKGPLLMKKNKPPGLEKGWEPSFFSKGGKVGGRREPDLQPRRGDLPPQKTVQKKEAVLLPCTEGRKKKEPRMSLWLKKKSAVTEVGGGNPNVFPLYSSGKKKKDVARGSFVQKKKKKERVQRRGQIKRENANTLLQLRKKKEKRRSQNRICLKKKKKEFGEKQDQGRGRERKGQVPERRGGKKKRIRHGVDH